MALSKSLTKFKPNAACVAQPLFNTCFYALRAIFVLYITSHLSLPPGQVFGIYATFMSFCYATTLAGGYVADKGLGVKGAAVAGGLLTVAGLACTLVPQEDICLLGLALAAVGAGLFKTNLLVAIGLMFEDAKDSRKDRDYSGVYVAGNVGMALLAPLCGFIGKDYGWTNAMLLIIGIFSTGTYAVYKVLRFPPSHKAPQASFSTYMRLWILLASLVGLLFFLFKHKQGFHWVAGIAAGGSLVYLIKIVYECAPDERKGMLTIVAYLALFALFAVFFEQSGSSLTLFMDKAVDRHVMGMVLPASILTTFQSGFVLVCGIVLFFVTSVWEKKPFREFTKSGLGFVFTAVCFWILAWGSAHTQENQSLVSLYWPISALFFLTLGELWIAPISQAKVSRHAPARYQSLMMSFWTMAIAYGHYFAGFVAQSAIAETSGSLPIHYKAFFCGLALAALGIGVFVLLSQKVWFWRRGSAQKERG